MSGDRDAFDLVGHSFFQFRRREVFFIGLINRVEFNSSC